jgi:hypothetical protein
MSTKSISKDKTSSTQQEVRIDLPGEKVEVWLSGSNLLVTLRKHRDVILDFKLGDGKSYTVESTHSDFYNANTKKIVFSKRKEKVSFKDGERLHLWVTRNFQGFLIIKCEEKLISKLEPNKIDQHQYDEDSKTKPAPIILTFGKDSQGAQPATSKTAINEKLISLHSSQKSLQAAAGPVNQECSVICVVEGKLDNAPQRLFDYFKKGGGKSGLADIDINDVATRNWILGQIAGASAYTRDNWSWLRASIDSKTHQGFRLVRAQVHMVRGKVRFYFSGYSKFNTVFGPGGFGPGHDRILNIFAGAGKTSSSFKAVGQGVLGSFKGNALVSFIFSSATSIVEWKDDVSKDGYDLAASLLMGLVKAVMAAAIVAAVVALIVVAIMAAASISISVLAIGALTVAIGIGVGYAIDAGDKMLGRAITGEKNNTDGLSSVVAPWLRKAGQEIEACWDHLMKKFPNDYSEISF